MLAFILPSTSFVVLVFLAGCLPAPSPRPAFQVAREAAVETKIRAFIAVEPMLNEERVRVKVKEQKEKATEIAIRAGGDLPIENEIVVQG